MLSSQEGLCPVELAVVSTDNRLPSCPRSPPLLCSTFWRWRVSSAISCVVISSGVCSSALHAVYHVGGFPQDFRFCSFIIYTQVFYLPDPRALLFPLQPLPFTHIPTQRPKFSREPEKRTRAASKDNVTVRATVNYGTSAPLKSKYSMSWGQACSRCLTGVRKFINKADTSFGCGWCYLNFGHGKSNVKRPLERPRRRWV